MTQMQEIKKTEENKKAKTAYTADETKILLDLWGEAQITHGTQFAELRDSVVNSIALKLGKSTRSIIAKLGREGKYTAKEYVTKTGEKPVKKGTLADTIGQIVGATSSDIDSLEKANKNVLSLILKKFLDIDKKMQELQE